jgi:hypothetical protein
MGAQVATQAVLLLLANLPAAITTAQQVFAFVVKGIASITEAIGDKDVTNAELLALVQKIAVQHSQIQAID